MDYLKPEFHDALKNEDFCYVREGRVYIGTKYWEPEEILTQISNESYNVYKDIFQEWLEMRTENLIQIADDFLDEFDQTDRFQKLKKCFSSNAVVPFIGAGMSALSGYPMWTEFLYKMAKHAGMDDSHLNARLENGDYELAAQELADKLGASFSERLESTFSNEREIGGAIQMLPSLFDCPVVTTNYDSLLKRCYSEQKCPFEEIIDGSQSQEISRILATGNRILIMLHGKAMTGRGRILTQSEYDQHYTNENTLPEVINAFCSKTLLFLGCSLSFDRTIKAIEAHVQKKGHDNTARHYAFLQAPKSQELINQKSQLLAKANIYPIWYSGVNHDQAIESLLQKLNE